jgi:hypothetical protein
MITLFSLTLVVIYNRKLFMTLVTQIRVKPQISIESKKV